MFVCSRAGSTAGTNFKRPFVCQQDVGQLQIAVDDEPRVQVLQTLEQLQSHPFDSAFGKWRGEVVQQSACGSATTTTNQRSGG